MIPILVDFRTTACFPDRTSCFSLQHWQSQPDISNMRKLHVETHIYCYAATKNPHAVLTETCNTCSTEKEAEFHFPLFGRRLVGWLCGGESMLGWPWAINRRLSQPSAASLIYGAPPIAPGFIWPLSNTCSVRERSPALAGPLRILNNPDGNCPFLKC